MFKKLLSTLTASCMILGTAITVSERNFSCIGKIEANALQNGICGDGVKWSVDNNILRIFGEGDISDYRSYTIEDDYWNGFYYTSRKVFKYEKPPFPKNIKEIIIEDGIKSVGAAAFKNYSDVKKITLPDSLELINEEAFYGCSSLEEIEIPCNVKSAAFANCQSLQTITIKEGVSTIEGNQDLYEGLNGAFDNCSALNQCFFHMV